MSKINLYDCKSKAYIFYEYKEGDKIESLSEVLKKNNINYENVYLLEKFKLLKNIDDLKNIKNTIMIMQKDQMTKLKNNSSIYNEENEKLCVDNKKVEKKKYVDLLKKYPDLLSFVLLLKSTYTDYIETYLYRYRYSKIYNIILNNQKEIIEMIECDENIIDNYFTEYRNNLITNFGVNPNTVSLLEEIETIFPDVPIENIEELINYFT